jgi:photosystem II stability/assembly factor-like uncharacterized protein
VRKVTLILGLLLVTGGLFSWGAGPAAATTEDDSGGIEIGSHVFGAMRARGIGPAVMSGRVSCLDVVNSDPRFIYIGTAGGGVWKSRNGGVNFEAKFDEHNQSIGAIAVDQAHPDTVWVGTGEVWVRNSVSVGDGIYVSRDGGDKWENVGLARTERIARIVIDPTDSQVVYAAALGPLWSAGAERGLYKTTDFGRTWQKILYVNDSTGCSDVWLDPDDPGTVYASMWQFRRSADFFSSGGPGSGLYKSTDGGASWREIRQGLPGGELGRIALGVSPADPNIVYASVEADTSGFYRSDDKGETWRLTSDHMMIRGRPFYFSLVIPDPQDPDRVYKSNTYLLVSRNGGKVFGGVGGWVHADNHALWINPDDPNHMIAGTDGGVYITRNKGAGWRHVPNLPVSQFYRVAVDQQRPFNVYGGLQDNGSWMAPSSSPSGIENCDWENLGGGDGFAVVPDPRDPQIVYWEWQGGNLSRHDRRTGESKDIKPLRRQDGPELRWHWNTPIYVSPSDGKRLYTGSQFLHRSTDRGESWQTLSPDLTTDNPDLQRQEESGGLTVDNTTAENHCTIFTICESPLDRKIIWVGTDDGNLQVTRNDGKDWTLVSGNLPGLPPGTWVSCVEASPHDRQTALVTFDGHRRGDMATYAYLTRDLGATWTAITTDEISGYAHCIRQDPVNPDLFFLGTEFGLYITLDAGKHWARFEEEFPPVSIRDMVIHQRESSLVMATHGRGIRIIDDITPLRQVTAVMLENEATLLDSKPAVLDIPRGRQHSPGDTHFAAGNPWSSARLAYYLKKRHMFGEMKIEIFDPRGELLKTLPGSKRKGLNFVTWSPRLKPPKVAPSPVLDPQTSFAAAVGPAAPEGTYTWRLTRGKEVQEGTVDVVYDPDYPHDRKARKAQQEIVQELYDMLARLAYVCEAMAEARDTARDRAAQLEAGDGLVSSLEAFASDLDAMHGTLMVTEEVQGISGQKKLREKVVRLYASIAGYGGRPTASQLERLGGFRVEIEAANRQFLELTEGRLEELNSQLEQREQQPIALLTEEEFAAREN